MLLLNPLPQRLDTGATPTFAGLLAGDGTAAAPSISFAAQTNMGFYRIGAGDLGVSVLGAYSFIIGSGGTLYGANGTARLTLPASGSVGLVAAGTNQNITLTPSGTGVVGIDSSVSVRNTQNINFAYPSDTTVATGKIGWWSGANVGVWVNQSAANVLDFATNGGTALQILASRRALLGTATDSGALFQVGANGSLGYATAGMSFGGDTFLYRSAAGCLTVDQNAAFSKLRLAESGVLKVQIESANGDCFISTETAGKTITLRTGVEITALTLDASQNATFVGDVATANAKAFYWGTRSVMTSPSDGVIRLGNSANTDFSRLQFGGTTASFPALARSGTNLLVTDATGGSYTPILAATFWATGPAVTVSAGNVSYGGTTATTVGAAGGASALPATPLGYIIVNVAGTPAKLPYYAA